MDKMCNDSPPDLGVVDMSRPRKAGRGSTERWMIYAEFIS